MRTFSVYSSIPKQIVKLTPILLLSVLASCLLLPCQSAEAYTLKIYSYPSNATVFLNDKWQGKTPLIIDDLKSGYYYIRLEKAGYEIYKSKIHLLSNFAWSFTLKPLFPLPTPTHRPTATPRPTRTPTPRPSTPTPTPSHVLKLMQKANEYFNKKWYLTPEGTNAFKVYKEILALHPSHPLAKERIFEMMNQYKVWGDNNYDDGDYEKAATYYERYMLIADYVLQTLKDQSILLVYQEIESRLAQAQNPPTPTPTPTPTPQSTPTLDPIEWLIETQGKRTPASSPTSTPTATPAPTAAPQPTVTPTPNVEVPLSDLIQRPGKLYVVLIGIEAYQDARLPQRPGLANAAQQLHEMFHAPSSGGLDADQLQLLLNEDATGRNVKRILGTWLRRRVTEADTVMLFYGGYAGVDDEQGYCFPLKRRRMICSAQP